MSLWRSVLAHAPPRRTITTQPATFANIKYELQARPPRIYHDYLVPTHSHLLALALKDTNHHAVPSTTPKTPLPQGHHLVYFPPTHPTASLLPDGTDTDQFPGPPFVRRLWAAGSLCFPPDHLVPDAKRLLLDGRRAVCVETIDDVRITGVPPGDEARDAPGHGEKIFVDVVRKYAAIPPDLAPSRIEETVQHDQAAVSEKRTLVFLTAKTAEEARQDAAAPRRRAVRGNNVTPTHTLTIRPSPALLFRFSALSFNAHAIHLDRQHCREVEGYRNLLVHGPLLLVLMCTALREAAAGKAIKSIDYRNLAPVFVDEECHICVRQGEAGGKWDVWVVGPEGGLCIKGSAIVEM